MPKADTLSPGAIKLLQESQVAQFATVLPDGSPQVTRVWVDVEPDGRHVLINTADGNLKSQAIAQNPQVAVSVVDAHDPWRYVIVRGTVVEPVGLLSGQDVRDRVCAYDGCPAEPHLSVSEKLLDYARGRSSKYCRLGAAAIPPESM